MPVSVDRTGLGGGARIQLSCDGCTSHNLIFNTSTFAQDSRRYVASLSIALAFLLTGHVHSGYHRTLGHAPRMLQEICAKAEMKAMPAEELGSWQNALDGCWLTRGHFSQNFTFIVKTT